MSSFVSSTIAYHHFENENWQGNPLVAWASQFFHLPCLSVAALSSSVSNFAVEGRMTSCHSPPVANSHYHRLGSTFVFDCQSHFYPVTIRLPLKAHTILVVSRFQGIHSHFVCKEEHPWTYPWHIMHVTATKRIRRPEANASMEFTDSSLDQ